MADLLARHTARYRYSPSLRSVCSRLRNDVPDDTTLLRPDEGVIGDGAVFLSHAGEDTTAAKELAHQLRRRGIDVWLDVERLRPGDEWMKVIESGLERARAMIVYVGRSGVERWVDREVRVALDRGAKDPAFRMIPILGPGAVPEALPVFLKQYQWIDVRGGLDQLPPLTDLFDAPAADSRQGLLPPEKPPYLGLSAFRLEDALLFFGREAEVSEVLDKLRANEFLAVVGGSGTGKSSLVRAGVIPALHRGRFYDQGAWVQSWKVATLRPGRRPIHELAEALPELKSDMTEGNKVEFISTIKAQLGTAPDALSTAIATLVPAGSRALIFVDQFEELFTQTSDADERRRFIDALLHGARTDGDRPIHVVITLRADFYGHCWEHPELPKRIAANQSALKRLGREQLRDVIEKPLALAGAQAEPGLVEVLLDDTRDEPGNLPLLEHSLLQLWERRRGQTLTHAAYKEIGGLSGALRNHAERVFSELTADQDVVRRIFIRLTQIAAGSPDTRRRVTKEELRVVDDEPRVERVLLALSRGRLITISSASGDLAPDPAQTGTVVEVSHEALIREWPRLRAWLDENRKSLIVMQRLQQEAEEWLNAQPARDPGLLLGGTRLVEAEGLLKQSGHVPPKVAELVTASRRRANEEKIRTRRLRITTAAAIVLFLAAPGWLFYDGWRREQQRLNDNIFQDTAAGLTWTRKDNGTDIEWGDAGEYCRSRSSQLGYSGWRLPTFDELKRLYDGHAADIALTGGSVWTSTPADDWDPANPEYRFIEFSANGRFASAPVGYSNYIRALCVTGNR